MGVVFMTEKIFTIDDYTRVRITVKRDSGLDVFIRSMSPAERNAFVVSLRIAIEKIVSIILQSRQGKE